MNFFDNYYIIPKDIAFIYGIDYVEVEIEQIKNDKRNYRSLTKVSNIRLGSISEIKNNTY